MEVNFLAPPSGNLPIVLVENRICVTSLKERLLEVGRKEISVETASISNKCAIDKLSYTLRKPLLKF